GKILRLLIERLGGSPEEALPYARELVAVEPFDEGAWAQLITTLGRSGRPAEARQQFEGGRREVRAGGRGAVSLLRQRCRVHEWATSGPAAAKPTSPASPAETPRASIVVLPFANLSDDPEQQYFADGITGNLTTDLSRIPDMLVISRNTAFTYRNKPIETKK